MRESEDDARGNSTQGAVAARAHMIMIREDGAGVCHQKQSEKRRDARGSSYDLGVSR